jgi:aminoglycoside/choline kinase family phosphotransferase
MEQGGAPFVLILEEIEGARMIDQVIGATLDEAKLIAQTVAALHAEYWETDALYAMDWLPPMNNDLYKGASALVEANWDAFVESWAPLVPPEVVEWCATVTPRYADLLDWWPANSPSTFTHTDCRAENYLFGGSAGADVVTMLDFQLSTRHVGTWDIANLLGMSVTIENRRAWEHEVITHYHECLVAAGVTSYDFDTCWRDYRYCLLQQAWAQIAVANIDPGNERGRLLLNEFVTRSFQAAADHDAGEFLHHL